VKTSALLLVVGAERNSTRVFQHVVAIDGRLRLKLARDGYEALSIAADTPADFVVLNASAPGIQALDLARQLQDLPEMDDAEFAFILPANAGEPRNAAMQRGIDEFLAEPLDPGELRVALHRMSRRRDAKADYAEVEARARELDRRLADGVNRMVQLLSTLIEARRPGAMQRAERISDLARRIAQRFGIPEGLLADLELATRLHELGYVALMDQPQEDGAFVAGAEVWRATMLTQTILQQFDGLHGAAEVVGGVSENWDGSGLPDHIQSGQIPLRSRILRLLMDYMGHIDRQVKPNDEAALALLDEHSGTLYDPMTLVHLRALLEVESQTGTYEARVKLPITSLKDGMVLAEDLCTDAGVKLLSRRTVLSPVALESILRRHRVEPIHQGASVLRSSVS
jgi:response regulator RpfG family c-di-GMP phosphodiesterase